MTLYKQIIFGITALFILLFISTAVIEFETTRYHFEQHQHSEINHTIQVLNLALVPYLQKKNYHAIESVLETLLGGNTYTTLKIKFSSEQPPIIHTRPTNMTHIPEWFISLELFKPVHQNKTLTLAGTVFAEIDITSSTADANFALWHSLTRITVIFICIFIFGLFSTQLIIKRALRPLHAISLKISQMTRGQFHGTPLPQRATKDLMSVIENLNQMSSQIEKIVIAKQRKNGHPQPAGKSASSSCS